VVQFRGKKGILSKITGRLLKKVDAEDEGIDKPAFSLLTADMIAAADQPVSAKKAVQVYKKFMLKVGYLEKDDIADFVRSLKEQMAEHEEELKYEIKNAKELMVEAKSELKSCKKQVAKSKDDDDREYAQEEFDTAEAELKAETAAYEKLVADLAHYKKDKREFLLNYINSEIHGDDWREKFGV
jgi:paraquat-inducible protein B